MSPGTSNTRLRDKYSQRGLVAPTNNVSGICGLVMHLLTLCLLLLILSLLSGTANAKLVSRQVVMMQVFLWETEEDLRKPCQLKPNERVLGCAWKPSQGTGVIHAVMPESWCDWVRLKTMGHELGHVLDWGHSDQYLFHGKNEWTNWSGRDCRWAVQPAKPKGRE